MKTHGFRQLQTFAIGAFVFGSTLPATIAQEANGEPAAATATPSLWDLAVQGGWFMIPIGIASIITIAFTLERLAGLRRGRILPKRLIVQLRELLSEPNLDPRKLWDASTDRKSPLGNVVKAAVLKIGRPQPEIEKSVEDAVEREVTAMTRNMRPINVVASISPLLGLLGTVQGMILAFMVTSTTSSTGTAKAQELAQGIYTALVTTFAGLSVAVVSVVLANFLEGRIERLLRQMEAIFLDLLPQLERFEGRLRVTEATDSDGSGIKVRSLQTAASAPAAAPPSAPDVSRGGNKILASKKPRSQKRPAAGNEHPLPAATEKVVIQKTVEPGSLRSNFDR